ncbi:MAG TPA: lasso peptide biosynthesis protein [Solirubrobacteraceae bacterium]|nr:lasso peptide biosynthesis protein [Solirubrobacteraceae bacterium]
MPPLSRLLPSLRAAVWALGATASARRQLAASPTSAPHALPPVPSGARMGHRGAAAALRATRANCLVQATVRQAWFAAHGELRDVVIGVSAPAGGFAAHAWLDGDPPCHSEGFHELLRRPMPSQR